MKALNYVTWRVRKQFLLVGERVCLSLSSLFAILGLFSFCEALHVLCNFGVFLLAISRR